MALAVEPARERDSAAILEIAGSREGERAAGLLAGWWAQHPESLRVVRDADDSVSGFYCMFDPLEVGKTERSRDPLVALWWRHLEAARLTEGNSALFCRRWLARDAGEEPSPVQAACWLDIKREYMARRPHLRRVYLTVVDLPTWAPVASRLGMRPVPDGEVELDGLVYHSVVLDFGPGSVDGWLSGLVATELGIDRSELLDEAAHQLVLDGRRVELTQLEYGVISLLSREAGRAVSRSELLERVWGRSYVGGSNVVDAVVRSLRKKLDDRAGAIETVRGVGYRFHAG